MPDVHTIRLRGPWQMGGPWQMQPPESPEMPVRVKLPMTCEAALPSDFCGRVRFTRQFQRPTGLERHEKVYLVVDTPWTIVMLTLNDRPLETVAADTLPARWNVTDRLADTNRLTIEVEYPSERNTAGRATAGQASSATPETSRATLPLLGEVCLEIHGV